MNRFEAYCLNSPLLTVMASRALPNTFMGQSGMARLFSAPSGITLLQVFRVIVNAHW